MNRAALITVGKKMSNDSMYLLSVFDLEPSGVIVHAYNQADSQEYILPITEMELAKSGFSRLPSSLQGLLDTIYLEQQGTLWTLQSNCSSIKHQKPRPTGEEVEAMIKAPVFGNSSIHDILVKGLVELCKVKPVGTDAVEWLGEWLLSNNPNKPRVDDD